SYGLTAALSGWQWWIPLTRRFEFPLLFAAVLLAVCALWWAPRRFGRKALPVAWTVTATTLITAQLAWVPIADAFGPTENPWRAAMADSRQLGAWYSEPLYAGHALAVPADRPDITYGLARFGGVEGKHLVSEMYDPFSYLPSGYKYADHQATVTTIVGWRLRPRSLLRPALTPNRCARTGQARRAWPASTRRWPRSPQIRAHGTD